MTRHLAAPGSTSLAAPALPPLLERIYESGEVETDGGERRPAVPVGIPRDHAIRLAALVRDEHLYETLETGMAYGLSTLAIASAHAARDRGRHIAIDPTESHYYEGIGLANLRRAGLDERVRFIDAGSQAALPRLVDEGIRIDFAFIDGMHLFDYALVDFFYIDSMLSMGGFVAFHDLWLPAVRDVVEFVAANRDYELRSPAQERGMAILRKRGPDRRRWDHYRPFATPRRTPRLPEDEARELFDRLREGAGTAAGRTGGFREHHLVLAGSPIRMRFAGTALEPAMLPAFAHAEAPAAAEPELEILIWDSESSGVRAPDVRWGLGAVRVRGDVPGYEGSPVVVINEPSSGAVTAFSREERTIVYWVADARAVPWYESGAPFRAVLHHWAAGPARHLVHAGAVGQRGAGVLLAGPSGSGKSTTALACLEAGLDYAGDDYVIVTFEDPPHAHCLYSTAKLDVEALERLPSLSAAVSDFRRGEEQKAVLALHGHRPELLSDSIAVMAVVVPSIGSGEAPALRPSTPAAALRAMAPSTLIQLPGAGQTGLSAMAGLVRRLPTFTLELGSDLSAVPDLISGLCSELTSSRGSTAGRGRG